MPITRLSNSNSIGDIYLFLSNLCLVIDFVHEMTVIKITKILYLIILALWAMTLTAILISYGVKIAVVSLTNDLNSSYWFIQASI